MSTPIVSPIFHPPTTTSKQQILISPGHATPGWITHIATLLSPTGNANAAFANPRNDVTLCWLLMQPQIISLCKSFDRVLPSQNWSAEDEANSKEDHFGEQMNLERAQVVEDVLEDLKRTGVLLEGFDENAACSLRVVEAGGPFEIRVDARGHESVVEVPDRRHVQM